MIAFIRYFLEKDFFARQTVPFVVENKIINWEIGQMYFVDTAKLHYVLYTFERSAKLYR